jgi:peptidyl-prolyl cis-trans isomerase A (cyclophilin A)
MRSRPLFRGILFRNSGRRRGVAILAACALLLGSASAAADEPRVRMTTSLGDIVVELFPDAAPRSVENFLERVDEGFYEGLIFHRVIAGFVVQTGGYDADLNYREPPGNVPNESANGLRNSRGTLAMARLTDPDSADTQFYINIKDNTHLDAASGRPGYTVFGRVVDGMDVVTEIELSDTGRRGGMAGVPDTPIVIEKMARL